jgi:hypothetical protein
VTLIPISIGLLKTIFRRTEYMTSSLFILLYFLLHCQSNVKTKTLEGRGPQNTMPSINPQKIPNDCRRGRGCQQGFAARRRGRRFEAERRHGGEAGATLGATAPPGGPALQGASPRRASPRMTRLLSASLSCSYGETQPWASSQRRLPGRRHSGRLPASRSFPPPPARRD